MGLFDTFVLNEPVPCTKCGQGEFEFFQTKELANVMEQFYEGEPANVYGWKIRDENERQKMLEDLNLSHNDFAQKLFGVIEIDKDNVIEVVPDGIYDVYEYCPNCEDLFYIKVRVKDGIFVGRVTDSE